MKSPRLLAVFGLWLAFLLACSGSLGDLQGQPPPDLTWVGVWEGPGLLLIIHPEGTVEVDRRGGTGSTRMTAPAQRFTTTEISVGIGILSTDLHVDQPPAQTDGRWLMVVDGITMMRTADVPPPTPGIGDLPPGTDLNPSFPGRPPAAPMAPPQPTF